MLYTRNGDEGNTGLYGTSERIPKDHPIFEALGSIDELNALTGLCGAYLREHNHGTPDYAGELCGVQEALFIAQAQLAGADKCITQKHIDIIERAVADIETNIQKPTSFIIPGATVLSALFDCARTIARRTERAVVNAQVDRGQSKELRAYLNRLSSFFYALARDAAQRANIAEHAPTYTLAP